MSANSQIAFVPFGETAAITADATAPDAVQVLVSSSYSAPIAGQYRVVNAGTSIVHLGTADSAATAKANAVAAVSGNPAPGIPLLPGAVEIFSFSPTAYFSAISASPQTIYITPGQGI